MAPKTKIFFIVLGLVALISMGSAIFEKKIGTIDVPQTDNSIPDTAIGGQPVPGITVPDGFKISIYAKGVDGARAIAFDNKGRMVVSQTGEGKISVIEDIDGDGVGESVILLKDGLNNPHGLAFDCSASEKCLLYIAESDRLTRYTYNFDTTTLSEERELMTFASSAADRHKTRTLLFLPAPNDSTLLISVGSTCDACKEKNPQHGKILSYNVVTGSVSDYAVGLRNSVFLTLHPVDGAVWATEMGRDGLGDDIPPDEVNIIEKGGDYGWPDCFGKNQFDPNFGTSKIICEGLTYSHIDLPAHSAPLGISFIPEEGWPEGMWHDALVAYHGSWNRTTPTGYKIARIQLDAEGKLVAIEDFVTGWLTRDGKKTGRPVDIKAMPGGIVYISDDSAGVIYRLSRI